MKRSMVSLASFLLTWAIGGWTCSAFAQTGVIKQFSPFSGGSQGLYWVPNSGPVSHIAFVAIHRTGDDLSHVSTQELPRRGFSVLGMTTRFKNNESSVDWELIALDVRAGVRFLRSQPGIRKVVLLGHSGGGPTTSFYQAVAENGPSYCAGPEKMIPCSSTRLAGFTPADKADGIIFLDAHPSNGVNRLRGFNAAVKDEDKPEKLDTKLNPFEEANGFNPSGDSVYSTQFVEKYSRAQSERMNDLIRQALRIREQMQAGKYVPTDDDAMIIYRSSARLSDFSTGVHGSTLRPAKLLKNDGTIDGSRIVTTVRLSDPGQRESDASFGGTEFLTLISFLSANAIRSRHSLDDVEWCSTNNSVPCAVTRITVPILVATAQAYFFIRDGELIYHTATMADKDFVIIEGMNHSLAGCTPCAAAHGANYENARTNLFNYMRDWVNARF